MRNSVRANYESAVVKQALDDLERIQVSRCVETKATRNVTITGSLVFAIAALTTLLHPLEAATSVRRLMFPFADVPWPRTVELQLLKPDLTQVKTTADQPLQIVRGDTLELYIKNRRGEAARTRSGLSTGWVTMAANA